MPIFIYSRKCTCSMQNNEDNLLFMNDITGCEMKTKVDTFSANYIIVTSLMWA